jgi:hypothetical protein
MQVTMDRVRELADRYEQHGLGGTSSGRFLRSIVVEGRMPRGRGIAWLEDLITKGDPVSVAPLVAEIEDLMLRSKRVDTIQALAEILVKVKAGWTLTEFKKSELERLRKQVNNDFPDLELDERGHQLMEGLAARKRYVSYSYWASRPVISGRLDTIFRRWTSERRVSPDDWQFVRDNFKGTVTDFESDRHPAGTLRWNRMGDPITVMSDPHFDSGGKVLIEVLHPTLGVIEVVCESLLVRAPR